MTEKQLKEIKFLDLEIKRINEVCKSLNGEKDSHKKAEYLECLADKKATLLQKKIESENFISTIADAEIRLIFSLRYIDLKSWSEIARRLNYDRTTLFYKSKNFFKKQ